MPQLCQNAQQDSEKFHMTGLYYFEYALHTQEETISALFKKIILHGKNETAAFHFHSFHQ